MSILGMLGLRKKKEKSSIPSVEDNPSGITAKVTYSVEPYTGDYFSWVGKAKVVFSDRYSPPKITDFNNDPDALRRDLVRKTERIVTEYKRNAGNNFKWEDTL